MTLRDSLHALQRDPADTQALNADFMSLMYAVHYRSLCDQ